MNAADRCRADACSATGYTLPNWPRNARKETHLSILLLSVLGLLHDIGCGLCECRNLLSNRVCLCGCQSSLRHLHLTRLEEAIRFCETAILPRCGGCQSQHKNSSFLDLKAPHTDVRRKSCSSLLKYAVSSRAPHTTVKHEYGL